MPKSLAGCEPPAHARTPHCPATQLTSSIGRWVLLHVRKESHYLELISRSTTRFLWRVDWEVVLPQLLVESSSWAFSPGVSYQIRPFRTTPPSSKGILTMWRRRFMEALLSARSTLMVRCVRLDSTGPARLE